MRSARGPGTASIQSLCERRVTTAACTSKLTTLRVVATGVGGQSCAPRVDAAIARAAVSAAVVGILRMVPPAPCRVPDGGLPSGLPQGEQEAGRAPWCGARPAPFLPPLSRAEVRGQLG